MNIILASKSPRRKEILEKLNIKFKIIESSIDENIVSKKIKPHYYCMKLAKIKCNDISNKFKESLIIGADTIVYHNKKILGKPKNKSDAINQLTKLSDQTHIVYTGVSLNIHSKNIRYNFYDKSFVTFYNLSEKKIKYYINHYEPYDKSGSYGIQDWSSIFVKKINGCYNNVVGFPLSKFYKLACNNYTINNILKENGMKWKKK